MSDHEIPLAIGLLKGISWVSSYYNSGLLLFNDMFTNYWSSITGEKKVSLSYTSLIVTSVYKLNYPIVMGCLSNDTLR